MTASEKMAALKAMSPIVVATVTTLGLVRGQLYGVEPTCSEDDFRNPGVNYARGWASLSWFLAELKPANQAAMDLWETMGWA